jgi:hypothetical protein
MPSFLIIGEISLPLLRSRCTPHDLSIFKYRVIPSLKVGSMGLNRNKQGVCHTVVALSFTLKSILRQKHIMETQIFHPAKI